MQKYILLSLLCMGCATLTAQTDAARFLDTRFTKAISTLDLPTIKNLLSRAKELEPAHQKVLLDDAEYRVDLARDKVSLKNSEEDLGRLVYGSIGAGTLGIFGLAVLIGGSIKNAPRVFTVPVALGCFGIAGYCGYDAWKGYRCSYAQYRLNTALRIAKLIGQAPVKA